VSPRRPRRRAVGAIAIGALVAATTGPLLARHLRTPLSAAAAQYREAQDRIAVGDAPGAKLLMLAAYAADSTNIEPLLRAMRLAPFPFDTDTVSLIVMALADRTSDPALAACLRRLLAAVEARAVPPGRAFAAAAPSRAARLCRTVEGDVHTPLREELPVLLGDAQWAWRNWPASDALAGIVMQRLMDHADPVELETVARGLVRSRSHPLVRVMAYAYLPYALHATGRQHEAEEAERQGLALARQLGPGAVGIYLSAGSHARLLRRTDTDSAVAAHARAWNASTIALGDSVWRISDPTGGRWARYAEALTLLDGGELERALAAFDSLAGAARRQGSERFLAYLVMRRGRTLVKLGRMDDAERDLLAARELALRRGLIDASYEAEHNLLHLYEIQGRDSLARAAGAAYLAQTRLAGARAQHLMANRDMAWYHQRRGETARALPYFERVAAQGRALADYGYWVGEYFELAGELDSALAYYRGDADDFDWLRRYDALVRLSEALGHLDSAVVFARLHDQHHSSRNYPERVPLLPGLLERLGRREDAEREYARAAAYAAERGQLAAWARLAAPLASLRMELGGDPAAAAVLADSAAAAARRVGAFEEQLYAEFVAGLARSRLGGAPRGLAEMRTAVRRAESAARPLTAGRMRLALGAELERLGREDEALNELRRAADYFDDLALSLGADEQRAAFRAEATRVSDRALSIVMGRPGKAGAAARFADWSARRKSRGILDVNHGIFMTAGLGVVQRQLPAATAVVDYAVTAGGVAALVVTRTAARVVPLAVRRDSLTARVDRLLALLVPRVGTRVDTARAALDTGAAARLYDDLIAPLAGVIEGRTRLIIIPDGPLHRLPFDLLLADSAAGAYVLDRFTVSTAPSLALLSAAAASTFAEGLVVVAAGPGADDAGVRAELEAVTRVLAARRPVVLAGDSGAKSAFLSLASGAGLLHIAAHARPNDANPAFAHLTLAAGGADEGLLHAFEIERIVLRGTLVVLSACETGVGRVAGGEGALSLSRAFLRAGAGGTVATLWPVGAGAAPLMERFYRELVGGRAPAEALRAAKLAQRRGGAWAHPLHWAAFALATTSP
jgi:CHAT domain-containing protein